MAQRAAKLIESGCGFTLIGRALIVGHLRDEVHRRQRPDASFEPLRKVLPFFREAEFSVFANRVAGIAAMRRTHIVEFAGLTRGDRPVQSGAGRLRARV